MRSRHRPDTNQKKIVQALRDIGCMVFIIGKPFDLLVAYRGKLTLMEVKNPDGRNKLQVAQEHDIERLKLRGVEVSVVRNVEKAIEVVTAAS